MGDCRAPTFGWGVVLRGRRVALEKGNELCNLQLVDVSLCSTEACSSGLDIAMALLRTAVGFCPIVGPAADVLDAASSGDRTGATIAVARLLVDVGSSCILTPAASASSAVTAGRTVRHAVKVLKHTLKQKAKNRVREAAVKLSLTAVAASAEATVRRRLLPAVRRGRRDDEQPSLMRPFFDVASMDAQAHARFAKQVYRAPSDRRGLLTYGMIRGNQTWEGKFWYAYVGGDSRQGFWYCPANGGHLVIAERGTCLSDTQDLTRDACIAIGKCHEALRSRARQAQAALMHQLHCHQAQRVTATGHSLGGAVVAMLAGQMGRDGHLHAAHIFNPGGLPDVYRYLSLHSMFEATCEMNVHRIMGDAISLGFLPMDQHTYGKKFGLDHVDSHMLLHFLPEEPLGCQPALCSRAS